MTRYYAIIEDVIYYLGMYRTINEARRRAEIEAERMGRKVANILTDADLEEIESEEGEQDVLDIDDMHYAQNVLVSICNQFNCCDCERCPLSVDGECGVGFPCDWDANSNNVVCNIGDTIYKIPVNSVYESNILNKRQHENRVYEIEITSVERDSWCYVLKHLNYYPGYYSILYGKEWFLTRQEAEAALAELKQKYGK